MISNFIRGQVLAFLYFICFVSTANAAILMIDLNFSETEVAALRQVAKARGEELIVVPTRDFPKEELTKFRELTKKNYQEDAAWLKAYDSHKDYDRTNWNSILAQIQPYTDKYGFTQEKLSKALQELKGVKISSLVISGHSEGSQFNGTLGSVSFDEIHKQLVKENKADEIQSVYLWGCFTSTQGAMLRWREAYPNLPFVAGFRLRSPSQFNSASTVLLKKLMIEHEPKMTAKIANSEVLKRIKDLNQGFQTSITLMRNNCYINPLSGKTDDVRKLPKNCIDRVTYLTTQMKTQFTPFVKGMQPLPNADTADSPLREFYNQLQTSFICLDHCKNPDEKKRLKSGFESDLDAHNYPEANLPCPADVIRLIKYEHLYSNFRRYFREDFDRINTMLKNEDGLSEVCKGIANQVASPVFKNARLQVDQMFSCLREIRNPDAAKLSRDLGTRMSSMIDCAPWSWINEVEKPEPFGC